MTDSSHKFMLKLRAMPRMQAEIARACGISKQAVWQWKRVPPRWVVTVSKLSGVPPEKIRPDIFRRS